MAIKPLDNSFKPENEYVYRMWLIWRSLPKGMKKGGKKYLERVGIDDDIMMELAPLRTQTAFCHHFEISPNTVADWQRRDIPPEYADLDWRVWAKKFGTQVMEKLWEGIEERKDPQSIKLYMQLIGEYTETSKVQVDYTTDLFDGMRDLVASLGGSVPEPIEVKARVLPTGRPLRPKEKTVPELLKEIRQREVEQMNALMPEEESDGE